MMDGTSVASKIGKLPEPLAQEVDDFVEFLAIRRDATRWAAWTQYVESLVLEESDFSVYLRNLNAYEDALASGAVKW